MVNSLTQDTVMDVEAIEWKRRFEEADREREELANLIDAIRSGQVDSIRTNEGESGLLHLLDEKLVEENERILQELERSNKKFRQVFERSNDIIIILDRDWNILDANRKAVDMWGYTHAQILELKIYDLNFLNPRENNKDILTNFRVAEKNTNTVEVAQFKREAEPLQADESGLPGASDEHTEIKLIDGHVVELSLVPIDWDGQSVYLATLHDITARKQTETTLIQLAQYDQLTGLANRSHCLEYLLKALARAKRRNGYIALLFLDLDKFKDINDSLGHEKGDQLLKNVAQRLKACVREGDLAARFGDDEFVLILDEISQPEDAGVIAMTNHNDKASR